MHISAEARDLQLAKHSWIRRITEIDGEERIDLPEGDDIAIIAHEADREDRLIRSEGRRLAEANELPALRLHRDEFIRGRSPPRFSLRGLGIGDRGAEDAFVNIEGELISEPALE